MYNELMLAWRACLVFPINGGVLLTMKWLPCHAITAGTIKIPHKSLRKSRNLQAISFLIISICREIVNLSHTNVTISLLPSYPASLSHIPQSFRSGHILCRIISSNLISLQWRHNVYHGASNHRQLDGLLNRLFGLTSKKTPKLALSALCEGNHRWPADSPTKGLVTRKALP